MRPQRRSSAKGVGRLKGMAAGIGRRRVAGVYAPRSLRGRRPAALRLKLGDGVSRSASAAATAAATDSRTISARGRTRTGTRPRASAGRRRARVCAGGRRRVRAHVGVCGRAACAHRDLQLIESLWQARNEYVAHSPFSGTRPTRPQHIFRARPIAPFSPIRRNDCHVQSLQSAQQNSYLCTGGRTAKSDCDPRPIYINS